MDIDYLHDIFSNTNYESDRIIKLATLVLLLINSLSLNQEGATFNVAMLMKVRNELSRNVISTPGLFSCCLIAEIFYVSKFRQVVSTCRSCYHGSGQMPRHTTTAYPLSCNAKDVFCIKSQALS